MVQAAVWSEPVSWLRFPVVQGIYRELRTVSCRTSRLNCRSRAPTAPNSLDLEQGILFTVTVRRLESERQQGYLTSYGQT